MFMAMGFKFCKLFFDLLGFFGEVFRGKWNGTEVAIKVLLEQELTVENIEDFCNEISILRFLFFSVLIMLYCVI